MPILEKEESILLVCEGFSILSFGLTTRLIAGFEIEGLFKD